MTRNACSVGKLLQLRELSSESKCVRPPYPCSAFDHLPVLSCPGWTRRTCCFNSRMACESSQFFLCPMEARMSAMEPSILFEALNLWTGKIK